MENTNSNQSLQDEIGVLRKQLADVSFRKTSEINGLRSRCVQLETDLSIASAELSASTNENALLRQQMAQLVVTHTSDKTAIKNGLKEFESRLDINNKTIDSLSMENEKLKKEAVSYKYSKTQDVHALNVKVTELDTIVSLVRTETSINVDALRGLFRTLSGDHEAMKSLVMELESYDHSQSNPQLDSLIAVSNRMESSLRDIGVKLENFHSMGDHSTDLFNSINKLTNENNELSIKLNKTNKKLNSAILKLQNDLISKNNELMQANANLSEATLTLRTSEQSSGLRYSQLEALYQTLQSQLQEYQKKFVSSALSVRNDCDRLIEENTEKQKRLSAVELEVTEWMTKYQQLNGVLVSVREDLTQCKLERNRELEQHQSEMKQARQQQSENEEASSKREAELTRSLSELQSRYDIVTQKMEITKEVLQSKESELSELRSQLADREEQIRTLDGKLAASEDENQKSLEQCAEMLQALQETEEELSQVQGELETRQAQWQKEQAAAESAREALQTQYNNLEANFNAVIEENNQYSNKVSELTLEVETLQDRMQSTDLIQQQTEQTFTLKLKALNGTVAELQVEKVQLQEALTSASTELSERQSSHDALSATHEQSLADLKACERVILAKQSEVQQLERDLAQKSLELADARMQTQTVESELAAATAKVEELNTTLTGRSVKYKSTQSKVVDLERSLSELRKSHKQAMDDQQAECERLRLQVSDVVQQLRLEAEQHVRELSMIQSQLDTKETELKEVRGELSKAQHSVVQLENAMLELQNSSQEEQTALMASVCSLEGDNKALSLQLSEQLTLVETKQSEIESLNDQLVEVGFKCDGLSDEIAKHLAAVKQWEELHTAAERSGLEAVAELEARLNAAEGAADEVRAQLLVREAELVQAASALADAQTALAESQSQVRALKDQADAGQSLLREQQQLVAHLEATLQGLQSAAQSTIDNQAQLIDSLEEKHGHFQQTIQGLTAQLHQKSDEARGLEVSHAEAERLWESRWQEQQEVIARLQLDVSEASQTRADLLAQRQSLLDANTELESQLAAVKTSEADLRNSQSILKGDYALLDTNFLALQKEAGDLKAALVSAESALQSVSQQQVAMVNKLSTKLNHRNDAIKLLKAEIVRLKELKRNDHSSLSNMLTGLQSEFDALHQQIAEFNSVGGEPSSVSSSIDTFNSAGIAAAAATVEPIEVGVGTSAGLPAPPIAGEGKTRSSSGGGVSILVSNSVSGGSSGGASVVAQKSPVRSPSRIKLVERTAEDFINVGSGSVEDSSNFRQSLDRKLA